jgi:phage terminase large subunit-like protein
LVAATIEPKEYTAHKKQSKFHHAVAEHRVTLFNGGRGSGKTTAGAIQALLEALQNQPGESGLIVAPTFGLLRKAALPELLNWLPRHFIKRLVRSPDIELELINGSVIHAGSADNPDSLRGPNRAWMWMDEPRNMRTREAFDIAAGQIRRGTEKIWLTTTPAGVYHWLYDLFVANPFKQQLRAQYTGKFAAQELDASFVSFEGIVFDNFSLEENVEEVEYNPDEYVYWGVDDGYAHGDGIGSAGYHPRAIVIAQLRGDGGINILDEYVKTLELPEQSINNIVGTPPGVEPVITGLPYAMPVLARADSSAAELRRRLSDRGIVNSPATHRIEDGIKVVRRFLCDGQSVRLLKIHPRCKHLIRELQSYRYDDRASVVTGGERKPMKIDDHSCDALRYLLYNFK